TDELKHVIANQMITICAHIIEASRFIAENIIGMDEKKITSLLDNYKENVLLLKQRSEEIFTEFGLIIPTLVLSNELNIELNEAVQRTKNIVDLLPNQSVDLHTFIESMRVLIKQAEFHQMPTYYIPVIQ